MAGDWIKVECATPDKPEVYRMAEVLDIAPEHVVGCLVNLWVWADQQTTDGNAAGVTRTLVDRKSGVTGFADAMKAVGWLEETEKGLRFPNFERHNGKTAKDRALTAKRVAKHKRKSNEKGNGGSNEKGNGASVTNALPREEKRREEIKETEPNGSDAAASLSERLWGDGLKALAKMAGKPPNSMRSVLGKWRQQHGDESTLSAILRAEKESPSEPVAWITATLKAQKSPAQSEADKMLRGTV